MTCEIPLGGIYKSDLSLSENLWYSSILELKGKTT